MSPATGRTSSPQRIGPILQEILESLGLTRRIREQRALQLWPEVVGAQASTRARAVEIRDGRLVVEVDGSAWMQELSFRRHELAGALNERLSADVVRDVLFVAPAGRKGTPGW